MCRPLPGRSVELLSAAADVTLAADRDEAPPPERWAAAVREAEGVLLCVGERLDAELVARAPHLRAVASMSAGTDHLALDALAARAIPVVTIGAVLTEATADLTFALLLAAARRLGEGERAVRAGTWRGWAPTYLVGAEVHGATLGILGMGRIGRAVARRARAFDMRVLYHNRHPLPAEAAEGALYRSLDDLLAESDHVVSLLPSTPETRGLIGRDALWRMRREAVLVNAGRGDTLDLDALVEALAAGRLTGVGLDVYPREPIPPDHPVLAFERVVALPHLGSNALATRVAMAETAARALVALMAGDALPAGAVRVV
jgi:glyoxylate reductase